MEKNSFAAAKPPPAATANMPNENRLLDPVNIVMMLLPLDVAAMITKTERAAAPYTQSW